MSSTEHALGTAVICDADPMARHRAVHVLEAAGFRTVEAAYGVEALLAAEVHRPRVVVLDLESAGVLGLYAIAAIRRAAPCRVIVFVPFDTLADAAIEHGASVVLPVDDIIGLAATVAALPPIDVPAGEVLP